MNGGVSDIRVKLDGTRIASGTSELSGNAHDLEKPTTGNLLVSPMRIFAFLHCSISYAF